MKLGRKDKLVKKAMQDLENGGAILTHEWLDENKCSLDDAQYIAESIAHAVKQYHFNGNV